MPSLAVPLDARELRVLEGLRLKPRKSFGGRVRGERMTQKKGISIEFADYREYAEGDDLRHLDWNVLARLGVPVTKTYRDEEDLAVHLLLDTSPSMDFGRPTKLEAAKRLATALGYVGLAGGDAVYPRALGSRERPLPALRGRAAFHRLSGWLQSQDPPAREPANPSSNGSTGTQSGLARALKQFAGASVRAGLVVLLTDGLDPEAASALRTVAGRGHEVMLLQVLSDVELDPDLEGDLRLLDGEGGAPVELTANSIVLKEYRRRLEEHNGALRDAALRVGGRYALVRSAEPLEAVVRDVLKRQGWIG